MKTYIAAKEAFWDDDRQLYYCYVGLINKVKEKKLKYMAFATNKENAIRQAFRLAASLNKLEKRLLTSVS